jgi:hypothetical protein
MDQAAQLAGFFVAHAIWIISREVGVYRPRYLEYSGTNEENAIGRDGEAGLRPAEPERGKIWKPFEGFHVDDWAVLDESFWRGVASHDDGAVAWKKIEDAS